MPRTDLIARLASDLARLPYAYHSLSDVDAMVSRLATDPAWVYGELMDDARVHEDCDNWIKADVVRQTAARVVALM